MLLQYYDGLIEMERNSVREAFEAKPEMIGKAHQKISDITQLFNISSGKKEIFAYQSALQDLAFSLHHAVTGLYRQSYVSQRVALENSVAAIYYSSRLIELKNWSSGKISVSWSEVAFSQEGVFTPLFIEAFCPEVSDRIDEYANLAKRLYSNLSDFTHKRVTTHRYDEYKFQYNENAFNEVIDSFNDVLDVVTFAFLSRYIHTEEDDAIERTSENVTNLCGGSHPFAFHPALRT